MQHKAKREVAKTKRNAYNKMYDRLDIMEGEKYQSLSEVEGSRWEVCEAG